VKNEIISVLQDRLAHQFTGDRLLFTASFEVDKHLSQKNRKQVAYNRRSGKPFIKQEPRSAQAKAFMVSELRRQASHFSIDKPFNAPMWLVCLFTFTDFFTKKGSIRKTLPDLSNLIQGPEDALEAAGIIANDSLIHSYDLSRRLPGKANKVELFLLDLGDTPWIMPSSQ
jgi:Holliday junction resolvase RusA-like endonuclease